MDTTGNIEQETGSLLTPTSFCRTSDEPFNFQHFSVCDADHSMATPRVSGSFSSNDKSCSHRTFVITGERPLAFLCLGCGTNTVERLRFVTVLPRTNIRSILGTCFGRICAQINVIAKVTPLKVCPYISACTWFSIPAANGCVTAGRTCPSGL